MHRGSRDDDGRAAFVEVGDEGVAVEGPFDFVQDRLVRDQVLDGDAVDQRRETDAVEAMPRHEMEAQEIAQRIGEGEDLGPHAAFGAPYRLALSSPCASYPWR